MNKLNLVFIYLYLIAAKCLFRFKKQNKHHFHETTCKIFPTKLQTFQEYLLAHHQSFKILSQHAQTHNSPYKVDFNTRQFPSHYLAREVERKSHFSHLDFCYWTRYQELVADAETTTHSTTNRAINRVTILPTHWNQTHHQQNKVLSVELPIPPTIPFPPFPPFPCNYLVKAERVCSGMEKLSF